jgi:hypothetical protein
MGIDGGGEHQRHGSDIGPDQHRARLRNGDQIGLVQAHQYDGDGIGALGERAGEHADGRAGKITIGRTRQPVAHAAPGELTHVARDALDPNDEQSEAGDDRNEGTDIHGFAADIGCSHTGACETLIKAARIGRGVPVKFTMSNRVAGK